MKTTTMGIILTLALNLGFTAQAQNFNSRYGTTPHNVPAAVKSKPENHPAKPQ